MSAAQHILYLVSQYELLEILAKNISTLDLYNLALSCREVHGRILKSMATFNHLTRLCLCDGYGLKVRQEFSGIYDLPDYIYGKSISQTVEQQSSRPILSIPSCAPRLPIQSASFDQEIEVRVWNLNCDATNALPCVRCKVNVCEECRWVPRVRRMPKNQSDSEPHMDGAACVSNIVAYCNACDESVELALPPQLSKLCDCNQYKRWICLPCSYKELRTWKRYVEQGGVQEKGDREGIFPQRGQEESFTVYYVYGAMIFRCPCGEKVSPSSRPRCGWCMRQLRREWQDQELININMRPSYFDADPCETLEAENYLITDPNGRYGLEYRYPRLEYSGPIAP